MRKILSLLTVLVLLLCTGQLLAQITATPKTQTVSCNGTATINVSGGGQTYLVTVNGGLVIYDNGQEKSLLVTNQNTIQVKTASGPGKVYVSLANNPLVRDSVSVDVTAISLSTISGSSCIAADGTATYSVTAQPGVSYLWRVTEGGPYATILSGGNTNQVTVKSTGTGNSLLRVYAFNDCTGELCAAPQRTLWIRKTFTVSEEDFSGVECLDASVLGDDSIVVFLVKPYLGLNGQGDYQWQYTSGLQRINQSTDGSAISFKVLNASVDQTVSITIGKTCNPGNLLTKVLKAAPPTPVLTQTDFCFPTNQTQATFTIDPAYHKAGYVYEWQVPVNWAVLSTTATSATVSMDANAGNVIVTAKNGSCGQTPKTFTVNRSITGAMIIGPACLAAGSQTPVNYTISPLNNNAYTWTLPQGWTFQDPNNKNGSSVWVIPDGTRGGSVSAITQGCGGTNVIPAFTVTIGPTTPLAISGNTCVKYNSTVTYSIAKVNNATTYQWVVPNTWGAPSVSADGLSVTVSSNVRTSDTVKVRAVGCDGKVSAYSKIYVRVGAPQPGAISGPTCVSQIPGTVAIYTIDPVVNERGYEWLYPASWTVTKSNGDRTITVTAGITAETTISVRANGCDSNTASEFRSLTVKPGAAAPGTLSGPACVAPGSTGHVYSIPAITGADSYQWSVPSGWSFIPNGTDGTSITINSTIVAGSSGTISVRGIACGNQAGPVREIPVSASPATPSAISYSVDGQPGLECIGKGSVHGVTLSVPAVSGAVSYTWTLPAGWEGLTSTTGPNNALTTNENGGGVVTVAAVSASGCTGTAQSKTLQRSGLDFMVTEGTPFPGNPFHSFTVSGPQPGSPTDYYYRWYDINGVEYGKGVSFTATFINITGLSNIYLDVYAMAIPGCITTLTIPIRGSGNTCTSGGTCPPPAARIATTAGRSANSETAEAISLYPNPASDEIKLTVPGDLKDAVAFIYSTNGTLITTLKASKEVTVDVSAYTEGTYLIILKDNNSVSYKKFIVKH